MAHVRSIAPRLLPLRKGVRLRVTDEACAPVLEAIPHAPWQQLLHVAMLEQLEHPEAVGGEALRLERHAAPEAIEAGLDEGGEPEHRAEVVGHKGHGREHKEHQQHVVQLRPLRDGFVREARHEGARAAQLRDDGRPRGGGATRRPAGARLIVAEQAQTNKGGSS